MLAAGAVGAVGGLALGSMLAGGHHGWSSGSSSSSSSDSWFD